MGYRMNGKSVVVTGAANGIGLAVARRMARAGASVVMADRDEAKLEAEVETIKGEAHEGRALAFWGDLTEKLAMTNLMATTLDAYERIDVLVNATRIVHTADPLSHEPDRFEETLSQNVVAKFRISQIAARRMMEGSDGRVEGAIVNVSSIYGRRAPPTLLAHSVASAALDQLTRGLAVALAPRGIRVNGVAIGSIAGRSIQNAFPNLEDPGRSFARVTPLGRAGQPEEAAEAVLFLASPAAAFITGEILAVDGGRLLKDPLEALPRDE